jgi:hypothetical protein
MPDVRAVTDLAECRGLWEATIPREFISDLWEVRECFHRHYRHVPYFMVSENGQGLRGLLPLSWNAETANYLYFPGETWHGKTWLEQNRLILGDPQALPELLAAVPGRFYLRYLQGDVNPYIPRETTDEIGYFFLPPLYHFAFQSYFDVFSHKTAKRLKREMDAFAGRGVEYRIDHHSDFETLIALNVQRFGEDSYFADPRFLESFRSLMTLLADRGWLRLTTVVIGGQVAAVDLGAVYNGTYTLLAGGTHADFPGIAKLINLYHMKWACDQHLQRVDFLCGDFNWKTMFHLTPRPLFVYEGQGGKVVQTGMTGARAW